jgi:hypothetical protein
MDRGQRDVIAALGPLALGHLIAMAGDPAAVRGDDGLAGEWQREIQIGAGLIVIGWGCTC